MVTASRIAVVLPAYNEAATIAETIASFHRAIPEAAIVIVDLDKTVVASGQTLRVGREEPADLRIEGDNALAPVHFVLKADDTGCSVVDTPGAGGSFVNGQAVAETVRLRHGDAIYAGRTLFKVLIESETAGRQAASGAGSSASLPAVKRKVLYTVEPCDSGLSLCRGTVDEIAPAEGEGDQGQGQDRGRGAHQDGP